MRRLPLSLRLAVRQLRKDRVAALLAAVFLAIPTTALAVVNIVSGQAVSDGNDPQLNATLMTAAAATLALPVALAITVMVAANLLMAARRNERMLALLSSVGAPPSTLFRVVSTNGIASGVGAAAITLVVGIPLGWLLLGSLAPFNVYAVGGLALLAIVFGWAASVAPALVATRLDTMRVLRGVPKAANGNWRADRVARVLAVVGFGTMVVGGAGTAILQGSYSGRQQPDFWVGALGGASLSALAPLGTALILIGIALAMPALFRMLGTLFARFGLAARLAARDAERGWARSVSAGATVLVTTFVIGLYLAAAGASSSTQQHGWELQEGQLAISLIDSAQRNQVLDPRPFGDVDSIAAALEKTIDFRELRTLDGVQGPFYGWPIEDTENYSGRQAMIFPEGGLPYPLIAKQGICTVDELPGWRCAEHHYYDGRYFPLSPSTPTIWVGDAADLQLILGGAIDPATRASFEHGEAIVFDPRYLAADGIVTIDWAGEEFVPEDEPGEFLPAGPPLRTETVTGHLVPLEHSLSYGLFLSQDAASELGLVAQPSRLLGTLTAGPDTGGRTTVYDRLTDALGSVSGSPAFWPEITIETGPSTVDYAWFAGALALAGGLSLAVSLVAVGLARVEGRDTDRTLAALGADPGIRRRSSAWYALLVVGVGAVSGTGLAVASTMLMLMTSPIAAQVPWLELGMLAFAVPLLAAAVAWFTPSRRT